MNRRRTLFPVGLSLAFLAFAAVAHTATTQQAVSMAVPSAVKGATLVGHMAPATVLYGSISLQPNRPALEAYANGVSNRNSPNYHRFLTPAQIGERFGAPISTVNAVMSYLKSKGLTVTMVGDSRMAILYKGRVDKLEAAFSTKLNKYHVATPAAGKPADFFSYATTPKVPSTFSTSVVSVGGLDSANPPQKRGSILTPAQARQLYNLSPLYDGNDTLGAHKGEGVNVGISNFDGYRLSNIPLLYSTFGLPTPSGGLGSNVHKVIVGGVDGESVTEGGEGDLDYQMALAMAPKSDVFIYDGIGGGLISVLAQEAQDNVVDVISESYGWSAGTDFYLAAHDQHLAMTAQGITYLCASGDSGTNLGGFDYPDFDPDVVMVGGSDAVVDGAGNRLQEPGWNGSGSGWSLIDVPFNKLPDYQVGSTVPTSINRRLFPDVALHATGSNFVFGGAVGAVGGTSVAAPVYAGQLAVVLQVLRENDAADTTLDGRGRLGRLTDYIYSLNGDPAVFTDLNGGDAGALPDGTESLGAVGWDFVTGWGAPNELGMFNSLLSIASIPLDNSPTTADIYASSSPALVYGVNQEGDVSSLPTEDGIVYSLQSIKQSGVGQVAAAKIDFTLQGDASKRRSASVSLVVSSPSLTTGFVYLFNFSTNVYDVVKTINGTGTSKTVSVGLDLTKYVQGDTVKILVRGLKPTRLGSTPFRFSVDKAVVTERVTRG